MFKGHPKGLIVAFFANMGERFGFYTMMAILALFLQAKFGMTVSKAGDIYSWFYFSIYGLALVGGILADASKKYKTVILFGQIIMFAGYVVMALPGLSLGITLAGLFTIALGNGLFKGNLQAVVGQMYDDPKYEKLRDSAYMFFYMGINVGAFFAPFAATGIRDWWLKTNGFAHDASLPELCHQLLDGKLADTSQIQQLANQVSLSGPVSNLHDFATTYLDVFSRGYNYAFGVAAVAMVISLLVYVFFSKKLPNKEKAANEKTISITEKPLAIPVALIGAAVVTIGISLLKNIATGLAFGLFAAFVLWIIGISTKEEKPRVTALVMVFLVVIFFWMSFHQNGLTLTFFARDYTVKMVDPVTIMFFKLGNILTVIGFIAGLFMVIGKKKQRNTRLAGGGLILVGGVAGYLLYRQGQPQNPIAPEVFQAFNPMYIVALTLPVMAFFAWLAARKKEPSTPRKIGYGMIIAAAAFLVMLVGSLNLPAPGSMSQPLEEAHRVMPYWLMSTYLVLTIAELFLSPMGLSFVSKVAPVRFQGLMQAGWLLATAAGNKLLFVGSTFWGKVELWQLWLIFIGLCLISAAFIFSIMRRLERITS
jgi:POT family proton-dependent oligopeptide transporter